MKKLIPMIMLGASALAFQACNNSNNNDSKSAADSTNAVKDSSTHPTATGGIAADKDDSKFATTAADGGMTEIEFAKQALTKTTNPKVKEFAQTMITDHTKASDELMGIAKTKNITLPTGPSNDHVKKISDVGSKTGTDYDKAYVDAMVADHKEDVDLFEKEAKDGKDADIKAYAAKTLPVLKSHLDHINALHDSMK